MPEELQILGNMLGKECGSPPEADDVSVVEESESEGGNMETDISRMTGGGIILVTQKAVQCLTLM